MSMPRTPERLEWVDAVRGFAVLLVVMYHAIIAIPDTGAATPDWLDRINDAFSPFRMPILMLLSGMLLPRSLAKPARIYISGKLRRIAWPYLVWTLVTLAFLYVGSHAAGHGGFSIGRTFALVFDPRTYTWYLAYLLAFYLLALVIPARFRYASIPALLIICAITNDDEGWSRATFLLAFFFAGDWVIRHPERWEFVRRPAVVAISVVLSASTIGLAAAGVPMRYEVWSVPGTLATIVCLMAASGWALRHAVGRFAAKVGRDSLVYYVTHWPVVAATAHLLALLHPENGAVEAAIMMTAGLAVSASMVWLRHRWWPAATLYTWPSERIEQAA